MKKIFAALLVTALVLTLAACHLSENEDAPITQTRGDFFTQPTTTVPVQDDTLVGAWNCKLIVDSRKMELEGVDASLECYIDAEFREDMTYSITIDQDALQASVEQFVADVQEDLVQAAYQQYLQQGLTKEQVDAMIQDQLGMTLQEMSQLVLEKIDVKEMIAEYGDMLPTAGTYREDGKILYITQPDGEGGFEEVAFSYELKNGKLRLSSEDEDIRKFFDFIGGAYLEFTRK